MKNRIALVTGSSRGIGRDIALKISDFVAGTAVHFKENKSAAEKVAKTIRGKGKFSAVFQADLTDMEETSGLIRNVEDKFGRIDILVNNFGPILVKSWERIMPEEWDYIFNGNLRSSLYCMKSALPGMRLRKWGRIINLGYSRAEQLTSFPAITPYAIAKAGLLILTRTVAASEANRGVTVNMVSPGLIEGGVLPEVNNLSNLRLGAYKDVSSAVVFLASDQSGFITGTNLVVAGGWKL